VETRHLRYQAAGLADIDGFGCRVETCRKVTGKDASSLKEACPSQPLKELSSTKDVFVGNEPVERVSIRNKDKFRILSRSTTCTGCDPSEFLDWLS